MVESWPIKIDQSIKIEEGIRHGILVSTASMILFRYSTTKNHEKLKEIFIDINYKLCDPPSPSQETEQIWKDALEYAQAEIERENIIPKEIRSKLEQMGIYKVVKENPTLYLADRQRDQIVKAVVEKPRNTVKTESTEDKDKQTKTQTKTTSKTKQLQIKDTMIDAVPTGVAVFSNPVDATRRTR